MVAQVKEVVTKDSHLMFSFRTSIESLIYDEQQYQLI